MWEKPCVIIGIDPGTTAGYAVIDLDGKVLDICSGRELDISKVIASIIEVGIPVMVGTDKAKAPDFVERFAVKTRSRIIIPEEDLGVKHKKELTEGYEYSNNHELDALAGALYAFKRKRQLIKKIDMFIKTYSKEKIRNKLSELVLKNDDLSIRHAAELLEKPSGERKTVVEELESEEISKKSYLRLYTEITRLRKDHLLLKEVYEKLKTENKQMEKKAGYFEHKIQGLNSDQHMQIRIAHKEERLQNQYSDIKIKQEQIGILNARIKELHEMLADMDCKVVLKRLNNLGWNEFEKRQRILNIKAGDILLVDDPNEYSDRTINLLKRKVSIVLFKKNPSKGVREGTDFIFLDSNKIQMKEDSYFAQADKHAIENLKNETDILSKIVNEYRKERSE